LKRGEFYRLRHPSGEPKRSRVVLVVSRNALIESRFGTVICAPVYTERHGLSTEVAVGAEEGLKHESSILCDALLSVEKVRLTDYVGALSGKKLTELGQALCAALDVEQLDVGPAH
jgi:mRNA interferase MazF